VRIFTAGSSLAALAVIDAVPSVAAIRWLRVGVLPGLAGIWRVDHVAMTIDDGPHPATTPHFLDAFADAQITATFFVLGERLRRWPELGERIVAAGHDLAVHGWTHRPHLLRTPMDVARDITSAYRYVGELAGAAPRYWRPPHGIPTATGLATARRLGMHAVLWSADGRDWRARATASSVTGKVTAQLGAGGVVLLHDAGGPQGVSSAALGAVPHIVAACHARGWAVGSLREHTPC
jgi:peptidoglycan/xylan/chitin deacetylase (PgdA/CDA1 family)